MTKYYYCKFVLRLIFFVAIVLLNVKAAGQTILISPSGNGGFENGTSFAANGWTANTGSTNQWVVGTGATAGFTGSKAAYVSNNPAAGTPPHTYNLGTASVSHFYMNVAFPAGLTDIKLDFRWICMGEGTTTIYDKLRVWYVPLTYTPTAGTAITANANRIQLGVDYNNQGSWSNVPTITLPPILANTSRRIVFEWINDSSLGTQPPAAIDNISLVAQAPPVCSQNPSALNANNITTTSATINWTAASPAPSSGYEYYYNSSGTAPNSGTTPSGSTAAGTLTANIGGLTANTTYYFWVRSVCGVDKGYWIGSSFFTGYCSSTGADSTYYISNFSTTGALSNITNNGSGYSASGYGNFTGMTVSQSPGQPINFSAAFYTSFDSYGFNIWVDWNNDLDFNDPGETVYQSGGYVYSAAGSFTVPLSATSGNYRMRIRADYLSTNPSACGAISYGETEDYTLNVVVLPCPTYVSNLATTTVTATSANISWTAPTPAPANGYQYYFNTSGTAPVATTTPSGATAAGVTTATLSPLSPNTTYYVWVRTNCNGTDKGFWVGPLSFYTGYCTSTSTGSGYYINDFTTTGGALNISNTASGYSASGYGNFTSMTVSQVAGGNVSFAAVFYNGTYTYGFNIWVDWNNDMDFNDPGELVYASGAYVASANGSFSIPGAAAAGNYRMRIRADYWATNPSACGSISSGETEDYTLTVAAPLPCSSNPSSVSVNILTATSVSVIWIDPFPSPANGFQYYYSTSPTNPTSGTTPSGSTAPGITSAAITGLSAGVQYYVWVRSNCGGALGQGFWIGPAPFMIPTCGVGNSTGTTTLGCHNVVSGGLGLNGAPAPTINCGSSSCATLEATYLNVAETTNYAVTSIPYAPPYQFNCLKNPISVNNDDVWSPIINLPFNFCFYGTNYNKVLVSSNGVITFDLSSNSPGGYSGWSFNSNIPNPALFPNSIFGVFHDIDPRVGGEVGWELITLNSGCRALVAAWDNIPMYNCNSLLYSGMMVLYENTNIIDVYIKQKPVCASWNNGNAIVGIQNAAGSAAVVPPNRNGLSPDWTATSEAWRFTPSGASTATVRWYQGAGNTGPLLGTGNTISVCPTSTTVYTAEVTYSLCNSPRSVVVSGQTTVSVNANKTWNGSVSTAWNNAANWTPSGVPTNVNCVVIPGATPNCVISGSNYAAYAHNLTVQNGGVLRVDPTNNNITVTDIVNVNAGGQFNLMDTAGLIQVNNVANTGSINMTRISQPMYRYDYTYWGSPVTQASNYTLGMLSPATLSDKYFSWTPYVGSSYGTWQPESAATVMDPRKGYIVRAPQTYSTNPSTKVPYTAVFTGTPNNGTINCPILFGTMAGPTYNDQYNLLGNPYPSSVSAASFLNNANNANVIDGTIYFWTHNSAPSASYPDPFYNDFLYNYTGSDYASWNKVGGVGTAASTGGSAPNGYIAAGQAFFVRSLEYPAGNAVFNNSMRSAAYSNSQFFRNSESTATPQEDAEPDFEKHRLWLNLMNQNTFSQIMVAYAEGATNGWDRGYDGIRFEHLATTNLYSVTPEEMLVIQSRPLPLNENDQIPLGFNALTAGDFTLRIDHFDGAFEENSIYLEDKLRNVIHDLKASPYNFSTAAGHFEDRLVLRYTNSTLSNASFESAGLMAFVNAQKLQVKASANIETIAVFEVNGKLVREYRPASSSRYFEENFPFAKGVYFAKVKLEDGKLSVQKLINQ